MSLIKIIVVEDYLVQGERKDQPSGWCIRTLRLKRRTVRSFSVIMLMEMS